MSSSSDKTTFEVLGLVGSIEDTYKIDIVDLKKMILSIIDALIKIADGL